MDRLSFLMSHKEAKARVLCKHVPQHNVVLFLKISGTVSPTVLKRSSKMVKAVR